jgi:deazaflavin-dependent oxidoreductase (nitroreductase family)
MGNAEGLKPPWWLKPANRVFIQMSRLDLSFGGESRVVLTAPGRKSGTPRSTPVTPMAVDGKRYVVGAFPGADWVRNVRAASEVTLSRGRKQERVRMVELSADEARPRLRVWPSEVPTGAGLLLAGWLGLPATSFAVTTADTITCGDLTIAKDGVQEP